MPIIVACPNCSTKLSAPDDAAGKMVRCPKPGCGAVTPIPAFLAAEEVAVVDAVTAPKPRPVRARDDEEDDDDRPRSKHRDDGDEDDRPRGRRRKRDDEEEDNFDRPRRRRPKSGLGAGAIAAIVIGSIVFIGGAGFGVYMLVSKKDETAKNDSSGGNTDGANTGANRPRASVPAGWVPHSLPGKFKAYFPKSPLITTTNVSSLPGMTLDMAMTGGPRERLAVIVYAMPLPPQAAGVDRDQIAEKIRSGILQKQGKTRVLSERSLTWSGRRALEMTLESSNKKAIVVYRQIVSDRCLYLAFFSCAGGRCPEEENGFFDNFELLE